MIPNAAEFVAMPWNVFLDRDSGFWVGICDGLALSAQGETFSELLETVAEIVDHLYRSLVE